MPPSHTGAPTWRREPVSARRYQGGIRSIGAAWRPTSMRPLTHVGDAPWGHVGRDPTRKTRGSPKHPAPLPAQGRQQRQFVRRRVAVSRPAAGLQADVERLGQPQARPHVPRLLAALRQRRPHVRRQQAPAPQGGHAVAQLRIQTTRRAPQPGDCPPPGPMPAAAPTADRRRSPPSPTSARGTPSAQGPAGPHRSAGRRWRPTPGSRSPRAPAIPAPTPRGSGPTPTCSASLPPTSTPLPVSASPPSCRRPTSRVGINDPPSARATGREPSSTRRRRLTSASVAARPVIAALSMRSHSTSERRASCHTALRLGGLQQAPPHPQGAHGHGKVGVHGRSCSASLSCREPLP